MANVYVYNNARNAMEYYALGENAPMPYNVGGSMSVGEFKANSISGTLWTDRNTMESWNTTRRLWGTGIYIGYAFKRIWEGGHDPMSEHYAGVAFDVGQDLDDEERNRLRETAISSGAWTYVEPAVTTPTWVHFDRRMLPAACANGGFPMVMPGSAGEYVLVLQDALNALGFTGSGLDGYYGNGTRNAVARFQRVQGLYPDGIAGCNTWNRVTELAAGIGRTPTVVNP